MGGGKILIGNLFPTPITTFMPNFIKIGRIVQKMPSGGPMGPPWEGEGEGRNAGSKNFDRGNRFPTFIRSFMPNFIKISRLVQNTLSGGPSPPWGGKGRECGVKKFR